VGGNFYVGGGTVNLGGGEANASGIVLVKSGKAVDITGNFVLTGGAITGAGTSATALAAFDPDTSRSKIKTGGSVAVIGGTAPVAPRRACWRLPAFRMPGRSTSPSAVPEWLPIRYRWSRCWVRASRRA
jgi:hypothetical protein